MIDVQEWDFHLCQCGHSRETHRRHHLWQWCFECNCNDHQPPTRPIIRTASRDPEEATGNKGKT